MIRLEAQRELLALQEPQEPLEQLELQVLAVQRGPPVQKEQQVSA